MIGPIRASVPVIAFAIFSSQLRHGNCNKGRRKSEYGTVMENQVYNGYLPMTFSDLQK